MKMITASELKNRTDQEELIIIDVRETWEYEERNIGARNIPLASLPDQLEELAPHKEEEVIVHCQSGKRSQQAQKYLSKQGFTNVKSLKGGIEAYTN
ncbi:rhodanese-like domain-containing protein [Fulvivirga sp. RKSG066]|uniref:rhodanese-like domain-containing protein n=1 Tax=Fulvivirga aurantia TaxID=2529383 RepID=UPI0012BC4D3F|nr:rhodanese-like domain-containing protein [Fulvivirga aurantia]MTI21528.1 rhodanese-like domain-containing protein [Fulvivirga aurantia]